MVKNSSQKVVLKIYIYEKKNLFVVVVSKNRRITLDVRVSVPIFSINKVEPFR
jgi:hypothetical protein